MLQNVRVAAGAGLFMAAACATGPASVFPPVSQPASNSTVVGRSTAGRVVGFGFTVRSLDASGAFFVDTLGAQPVGARSGTGPELAAVTGLEDPVGEARIFRVGEELVTLTQYRRRGRSSPPDAVSNDLDFQHLALVARDIEAAHRTVVRAGVSPVSRAGPERIPDSNVAAAGIRAFYFRDADAHPLELIWFPKDKGAARWHGATAALLLGIDHSAIVVASTGVSLAFYRDLLGLGVAGRSFNEGVEQARLSGVPGARVQITGLRGASGPGIEFLEYVAPGQGRPRPAASTPRDYFHWESIVEVPDLGATAAKLRKAGVAQISSRIADCQLCAVGRRALLVRDPDGHAVRLVQR